MKAEFAFQFSGDREIEREFNSSSIEPQRQAVLGLRNEKQVERKALFRDRLFPHARIFCRLIQSRYERSLSIFEMMDKVACATLPLLSPMYASLLCHPTFFRLEATVQKANAFSSIGSGFSINSTSFTPTPSAAAAVVFFLFSIGLPFRSTLSSRGSKPPLPKSAHSGVSAQ